MTPGSYRCAAGKQHGELTTGAILPPTLNNKGSSLSSHSGITLPGEFARELPPPHSEASGFSRVRSLLVAKIYATSPFPRGQQLAGCVKVPHHLFRG
jgi:hypothetical protein